MAELQSETPRISVKVMIFFELEEYHLNCGQYMTISDVRDQWLEEIGRTISVALLSNDDQYLSDDLTISEVLPTSKARILELHAYLKEKYWLQAFGLEDTRVEFEMAKVVNPAAVWREIRSALEIYTDDFRLICEDAELDKEQTFEEQGVMQGSQLIADLRVIVKVKFEERDTMTADCFSSESIADLRKKLNLDDNIAVVTTSSYRHVLADPLRLCYVESDIEDLQMPIELTAERKVMVSFEPITLEHLRQQLPVALTCTPIDLYDIISERFQLTTEYRLAIRGQELNNSKCLRDQLIDTEEVIQVDILRPCKILDLWEDPLDESSYEDVYLYSTEPSFALFLRNEVMNQRLYFEDIKLTIFGSMVDVFGSISGQHRPILGIERDIERILLMLSFDGLTKSVSWAKSLLTNVVPRTGGLSPKEIMRKDHLLPLKSSLGELRMTEDTLAVINPKKIFISSDKKLKMLRLGHGATFGDVRARMQQIKGSSNVGLKAPNSQIPILEEAMDRKSDVEFLYLTSSEKIKTKVTVAFNDEQFDCCFEAEQVTYSDVMVEVGRQCDIRPQRRLFDRNLFCCGCGRQLSLEEEPYQTIPAPCCRVKSLQLTDRRVKDVGVQTAVPRNRDVGTYTLDPESRDKCVGTKSKTRRAIINATSDIENVATAHPPPPPPVSLRVAVRNPSGQVEKKTVEVEGGSCRDLLATADRHFLRVGASPVVFCEEMICDRGGEERRSVRCFEEESRNWVWIDAEDGGRADWSSRLHFYRRFLRPSSPLPSSPNLLPIISIYTEAEFLASDPHRRLQSTSPDALTDLSSVALMRGIRSGEKLFWKIASSSSDFVDAESGKVFEETEIPGARSRVFALLRRNDRVPRVEVPSGRFLFVLRRRGLEMRMEGGRVRCSGREATDGDIWSSPPSVDDFLRNFTAAARTE